jgi:hypothetical protein
MRRSCYQILVLVVLVAGAACGSKTPTTPTTPTPTTTTETFTGTLNKNGAVSHSFSVTVAGTVTVTATTLDPVATIGLALGTWNGVACQVVIANDAATMGTTVPGTATAAGSLCARIYDAAGTVTNPVAYTLTAVHP